MLNVSSGRRARGLRAVFLASAALTSVALPAVSHAQVGTRGDLTGDYLESQSGDAKIAAVLPEAQAKAPIITTLESQATIGLIPATSPDPQIAIANPNTPTTARDPVNITGIGQMVVDNGGGSVGLCTGTLINPRTVIFAAHCVNSRAANAYGANSGGTGIAFGFETNTRANAAGETDELVRWLLGATGTGAGRFQTNVAQALYNVNYLAYNPFSLEPNARSFLYGDVAVATLDTPAANVPTWALLFSPLTNTATIGAAGTGFNVDIVGYGRNGTGEAGTSTAIDFRRRAAENILGALTDLQTFESFLFGGAPNGLTQNLYFIDFDDPRRGMSTASPFDFNAFRDNSVPSGREGITSSGDSGGPLILRNTFSRQVVIGVLSGGYTRFFAGQPANGYGTVAFYQPLYLYWDWIAANNPYHYVSAVAGNGSWTDPTRWVTTLDPAYLIQSGTTLVNGLPANPGEQKNGTSGDFGQTCFQSGGISECRDTRTGVVTIEQRPIGTAESLPGRAELVRGGGIGEAEAQAGGVTTQALPLATLANGLPGATNFVPNNSDPVRATSTAARYFDVTLSATGTTTLSGANVTIDRLTIGTSGASLVVSSGASLTSLMNINQLAGFVTVNGTVTSVGDYSLFGGGLLGTGRINTPFLTSVAGQIAPGGNGTVGTLTIGGNLILTSGSRYFVDLGPGNTSDRLAVVTTTAAGVTPADGVASIGGQVSIAPVAGHSIRAGDLYTILTAQGGVSGTFGTLGAISAILTPQFVYSATSVQVRINAGLYANVVSANSPVQRAYAQLLDQNRSLQGNYPTIYAPLDLQNASTIQSTLESLAPRAETLRYSLATLTLDSSSRFNRDRLGALEIGNLGGTVAYIGQPYQVAALNLNGLGGAQEVRTDSGTALVTEGKLPETMSAYIAGGYLDGDSRSMSTAVPAAGRDQFDGFYIALGIETELGANAVGGFAASYTDVKGTTAGAPQEARAELYQATVYGKSAVGGGLTLDATLSIGSFDSRTVRNINFLGQPYRLTTTDMALAFTGEVGLGGHFDLGTIDLAPRVALRGTQITFDDVLEQGGGPALTIDRDHYKSLQGRVGLTAKGSGTVRPYVTGAFVHDFLDQPGSFGANFVGGIGPQAAFALAGDDNDWFEVGGGLTYDAGSVEVSLGADTTIARDDVSNQSYRASVAFKF